MSRRNLVWLTIIVVAGVAAGATTGWWIGLAAAGAVLVVSEVYERWRRRARAVPRTGEVLERRR